MSFCRLFLLFVLLSTSWLSSSLRAQSSEGKPEKVKALLICGGCCHDYDSQKLLIKKGLEARAHIEVTVVHQGGNGTRAEIELYKDPNWAKPYDVILHDECFADDKNPAWLERILAPHREGKPAVMIHCAMHCYRVGNDDWFELCGVTSHGHGPHYPHEVRNVLPTHPIMEGFGAAWFNPAGELYRIAKLWETATPLGTAKDRQNGEDQVCVWTNDYRGTRVFGTTLGHHNETVDHPTFMNLLTRGTLWAAGKLEESYLKEPEPQLVPVNLAAGKPVTASSEQSNQNNLLEMATDDKTGTRWCAADGSFPQWVEVDLQQPQAIRGVEIVWESPAASYVYRISGSNDQQDYRVLFDSTERGVRGNEANHSFEAEDIRFLKIDCVNASPGSWASIRELRVHGTEMRVVDVTAQADSKEKEVLGECRIPEGFEATLFAAPPAVNYPVFVAAATDGTVFVSSDKNGSLDREPMRGSVVRLVDIDGDGRADSSNLFVDNVDSPRGLVWDHDRLYLMHPPHLSAFIDDDGDGVSDRQEILVKNIAFGFKDRPADHTSNGVTMGIDGWLYLAIGDFGFMEAEGADGRKLQLRGGGVVRVRTDGTGLELYSNGTRNILEVGVDPLLRGFARDNTNDGGGWDVRLHHFSGLEDHGYPRRYINFADEIVAPLADYGGGSGCGALYMDEPGMPEGFGDALYTADWGRQEIYRHPLKDYGATVIPEQFPFLGLIRATDLDVDGSSHIYSTSWKGATFTYSDENVGYVVRLSPKGFEPNELPDFEQSSDDELVALLRDDSHRRRLEAQRALIRRSSNDAARDLTIARQVKQVAVDPQASLKSRVAAIFAIKQILGKESTAPLVSLSADATIAAWAIRALGDRWDELDPQASPAILAGLQSQDPRTQLESLIAAARLGRELASQRETLASAVTRYFASDDLLLRHTAVAAAVELKATAACASVIQDAKASEAAKQSAFRVLASLHHPEAIEALAKAVAINARSREMAFAALCRLVHREAEWKGNSWGTRPDTRGPYYEPERWSESERIEEILVEVLQNMELSNLGQMLLVMAKNRLDISPYIDVYMRAVSEDRSGAQPLAIQLAVLNAAPNVSEAAVDHLAKVAAESRRQEMPIATADAELLIRLLARGSQPKATEALVQLMQNSLEAKDVKLSNSILNELKGNAVLARHGNRLSQLSAEPISLQLAASTIIAVRGASAEGQEVGPVAAQLESLWSDESLLVKTLETIQSLDARDAEPIVRRAMLDNRNAVLGIGKQVAVAWNLANLDQWTGPKIAQLDAQKVFQEVLKLEGDIQRGQQVFALLGCAKCHDVAPTEDLRGPYLPNVAKTYKRDQLTEAILFPSKSIAQGFVQNVFLLDDGRVLAGFVTNEGATELTIRDSEGKAIQIPIEAIEQRSEKQTSVMPEGLANTIPVAALADLVTYLQSLGG